MKKVLLLSLLSLVLASLMACQSAPNDTPTPTPTSALGAASSPEPTEDKASLSPLQAQGIDDESMVASFCSSIVQSKETAKDWLVLRSLILDSIADHLQDKYVLSSENAFVSATWVFWHCAGDYQDFATQQGWSVR